jgi:hypothetical protein
MNNQELIDKAVHELNGVLPSPSFLPEFSDEYFMSCNSLMAGRSSRVCSSAEFQQRARELGYVNGYRYGVEYPTNGKRPDLPDDVVVSPKIHIYGESAKVSLWHWGEDDGIDKFKITDLRYKPADTNYLGKLERFGLGSPENLNHKCSSNDVQFRGDNGADWFDYTNQKALRLPPVGVDVEYQEKSSKWTKCKIVFLSDYVVVINGLSAGEDVQIAFNYGDWPEFRPLDFNRKAEAERKAVIESACRYLGVHLIDTFQHLYDAGFLRMPEDK